MRLLLDTHILLWWLADDDRLGGQARQAIADPANDVLVSTASLWEIVVKSRVGKLVADIAAIEAALRRASNGSPSSRHTWHRLPPCHRTTATLRPSADRAGNRRR